MASLLIKNNPEISSLYKSRLTALSEAAEAVHARNTLLEKRIRPCAKPRQGGSELELEVTSQCLELVMTSMDVLQIREGEAATDKKG